MFLLPLGHFCNIPYFLYFNYSTLFQKSQRSIKNFFLDAVHLISKKIKFSFCSKSARQCSVITTPRAISISCKNQLLNQLQTSCESAAKKIFFFSLYYIINFPLFQILWRPAPIHNTLFYYTLFLERNQIFWTLEAYLSRGLLGALLRILIHIKKFFKNLSEIFRAGFAQITYK